MRPQEIKFEYFKSRGPGGQHKNKRQTAVRVVHVPTGLSGVAQKERSQARNKEAALEALQEKLFFRYKISLARVPTRRSRKAKEKTLEAKRRRGSIKRLRSLRTVADEE